MNNSARPFRPASLPRTGNGASDLVAELVIKSFLSPSVLSWRPSNWGSPCWPSTAANTTRTTPTKTRTKRKTREKVSVGGIDDDVDAGRSTNSENPVLFHFQRQRAAHAARHPLPPAPLREPQPRPAEFPVPSRTVEEQL